MRPKICFIISHLPQGGAERQMVELVKKIYEYYSITILLYASPEIFYTELFNYPVRIIKNENRRIFKNKVNKWIDNIRFVRSHLKTNQFDILHTFLFHNGLLVRLFAPLKYKNQTVYSVRNSYEDASKLVMYLDSLLIKKSICVFNSKKSMNQFLSFRNNRRYSHKCFLIYNGFDADVFNDKGRKTNEELTIANVGRFSYQKNQMQLVRVFHQLTTEIVAPLKLLLIGDTEQGERDKIFSYITTHHLDNNIHIVKATDSIAELYKSIDIFALTSHYEGCPNVLFEAQLSGCLCIISRGANSDNFIDNGINGFEYDGSDDDLKKCLKKSIISFAEADLREITENGTLYAKSNFSTKKMVEHYLDIYYRLLAEKLS